MICLVSKGGVRYSLFELHRLPLFINFDGHELDYKFLQGYLKPRLNKLPKKKRQAFLC